MGSIMTLAAFAEMSGGQRIESKVSAPVGDMFSPGCAYPIEITEDSPTQSKNGFYQIEMKVSIVLEDGSLKPAGRIWETLPLVDHKAHDCDESKLEFYRNIFGRNLLSLLRSCDPKTFAVYSRREGSGKSATYYDVDGSPMTVAERRERTALVESAVIGAAKAIQEGKISLAGKRLFLVKAPGSNGKVYTNYFGEQPHKFPLAEGCGGAPF